MDLRKNIKILFFSDSHLGFDYSLKKTELAHRGEDFFSNFNFVLKRAKDLNVDLIIHGGDLFHKENSNQKIVDRAYDSLISAADNNIPIVLIPGNHDGSQLPITLFSYHPLIHIVNQNRHLHFKLNGKDFGISAIPFLKKVSQNFEDNINPLLGQVNIDAFNILLVHQSFEGAEVGQSNFKFRKGIDVLGLEQIPDLYDLCLSGHIHRHQILEKLNKKVIYCGSTEKTTFAEFGEDKGFVLLEFKKQDDYGKCEISFEKISSRKMMQISVNLEFNSSFELEDHLKSRFDKVEDAAMLLIDCKHESTRDMMDKKLLQRVFGKQMMVSVKGSYKKYISNNYKLKL